MFRERTREKGETQRRAAKSTPKKENNDIQGTTTRFQRKQPGSEGDESQKDVLWNSIGKSFGGAISIYMDLGPAWLTCRYTEVQQAVVQPDKSLSSHVQIITPFSALEYITITVRGSFVHFYLTAAFPLDIFHVGGGSSHSSRRSIGAEVTVRRTRRVKTFRAE